MKKIIIWIILIILAFLLVRIIIKSSQEKYFKQNEIIDNGNLVINRYHKPYIDTAIYVGLNVLKVVDVTVTVTPMDARVKALFDGQNADMELKGFIVKNDDQYEIFIDDISKDECILLLSHELIHLKQYQDKRLVILDDVVAFDNQPYKLSDISYSNRPWELEAFAQQKEIRNKMEALLY